VRRAACPAVDVGANPECTTTHLSAQKIARLPNKSVEKRIYQAKPCKLDNVPTLFGSSSDQIPQSAHLTGDRSRRHETDDIAQFAARRAKLRARRRTFAPLQ
jgi:hypothetical protein